MTSSRRRPGATRGFRPRATRTHRRHAVVVVGAKRRCRPLPLPSDPRGVADPRARRPDVDAPSIRRVSRGATARLGTDAIAVVSPGAAGLVLAEVKKRTERRPRGSHSTQMKEPRLTACRCFGSSVRKRVARWGGMSPLGMGPPAIISSPALVSALLAFTVAQVAKVFTHWCAARPVIQPPTAPPITPKIPPAFLPNALTSNAASHRRSTAQAHDG